MARHLELRGSGEPRPERVPPDPDPSSDDLSPERPERPSRRGQPIRPPWMTDRAAAWGSAKDKLHAAAYDAAWHGVRIPSYYARLARRSPEGVKKALTTQADHPVRWVECVREMAARGATHMFECGPGKVLAPLARRIIEGMQGLALADRAGLEQGVQLSRSP